MKSWTYRVVEYDSPQYSTTWFLIHEVYYGNNDNVESWSSDPIRPGGDTIEELKKDLKMMKKALKLPPLKMRDLQEILRKQTGGK